MPFLSRSVIWYPIVNHIREALTDYYTTWENEGRVTLEETAVSGGDPYDPSTPLGVQVIEFKISGWNYKMPNKWRGINCEDTMTDTISGDRVKYSAKIDFAESEEADGSKTYTYTVTCTPDSDRASEDL